MSYFNIMAGLDKEYYKKVVIIFDHNGASCKPLPDLTDELLREGIDARLGKIRKGKKCKR